MFISVANMTLARKNAYLAHVKAGIKQDTLSALRQAPVHLDKLFPDQILKRVEEDIAQHENKGCSTQPSTTYRERFQLYHKSDKGARDQRSSKPVWKNIRSYNQKRKGKASQFSAHSAT